MRISKVAIRNFRNFKDLEVELGSQAVLLGENSVGKTNFLAALQLVLDSSTHPQLSDSDFHRGGAKYRGTEIEIQVQFSDFTGAADKNFLNLVGDCLISEDPPVAQVAFLYRPRKDVEDPASAVNSDYYESIVYGGSGIDRNNLREEAARRFRKYVRFRIIPAIRDLERDMNLWRQSPLRRLIDAIDLDSNPKFEEVVTKVKEATDALAQIDALKELEKALADRLSVMIEGLKLPSPQIGLLPTSSDELQKALTILIEGDLSLNRSSIGLANVLYLCLQLVEIEALAQKKSSRVEFQYTFLAIEEPEAHLHPHLQRLVFRHFLDGTMPILLSTHSPNIVSIAKPDSFVVLKKLNGQTIADSTAHIRALPGPLKQDIQRYLDATRGEGVFAKGVILVEGDAELFLVPQFGKLMKDCGSVKHTLDGVGVSVCSVAGTDFTPYIYFFGPLGLNIPLVVLTDGDKYVGLDRQVKQVTKGGKIPKHMKEQLGRFADEGQLDEVRCKLDDLGFGIYEGLNRGIKIAKLLNEQRAKELRECYNKGKWAVVRDGLEELGVIVNDLTLESTLLAAGYADEFAEVYRELGATSQQTDSFKRLIDTGYIDKVIQRIEESGRGKGRFAQRLTLRATSAKVPREIQTAIIAISRRVADLDVDFQPTDLP